MKSIDLIRLSTDLESIAAIINNAMDSGDWHTPSASEIALQDINVDFINGTFRWHLHNGGSKRCWFQFNKMGSVHLADLAFNERRMEFVPENRKGVYCCLEIAELFKKYTK